VIATRSQAADEPSKLEQGLAALEASNYDLAEKSLKAAAQGKDRGAALVGMARVELATGRYAEATKTAASAEADRGVRSDAIAVHGDALARQGKAAEAVTLLESVKSEPNARRARLLLGQLYIQLGRRSDATDPLMAIISLIVSSSLPGSKQRRPRAPKASASFTKSGSDSM